MKNIVYNAKRKYLSLLTLVALLGTGAAFAQERTASGPLDTQATWSALSTEISNVNSKADDTKTRLANIILCSDKGMLYAPDLATSDANGCKALAGQTTLGSCYERAGYYGTHVTCNNNEVVTKVCSSGGGADCVSPAGAIYSGGQTALDGWQGPRTPVNTTQNNNAWTVITCCKMQ